MKTAAALILALVTTAVFAQENSAPTTTTMVQVTPGVVEAGVRSKVSRTKNDMRSMATAIEAYFVDNNEYPKWSNKTKETVAETGSEDYPGFLATGQLTTPVSYMTSYFTDPFATKPDQTFGFYSVQEKKGNETVDGWILLSSGPDGKNDAAWKLYNIKEAQPSAELLLKSYDPTNGTVSSGDLFRVKQ